MKLKCMTIKFYNNVIRAILNSTPILCVLMKERIKIFCFIVRIKGKLVLKMDSGSKLWKKENSVI